jgi:hypothetical protein
MIMLRAIRSQFVSIRRDMRADFSGSARRKLGVGLSASNKLAASTRAERWHRPCDIVPTTPEVVLATVDRLSRDIRYVSSDRPRGIGLSKPVGIGGIIDIKLRLRTESHSTTDDVIFDAVEDGALAVVLAKPPTSAAKFLPYARPSSPVTGSRLMPSIKDENLAASSRGTRSLGSWAIFNWRS